MGITWCSPTPKAILYPIATTRSSVLSLEVLGDSVYQVELVPRGTEGGKTEEHGEEVDLEFRKNVNWEGGCGGRWEGRRGRSCWD